jgi:hypothetical protein
VVDQRTAGYREQLQRYARAAAHVYGLPLERVRAQLIYLASGVVESVPL